MKILIVSDTHGTDVNFDLILEREMPIDKLIHLGDSEGFEDYIEAVAECPVHMVCGNCDYDSDYPYEDVVEFAGHRALITHGHLHQVYAGTEALATHARHLDADIAMFGHTHKPMAEYEGDVLMLNPGSVTFPRQKGRRPSYIVMEAEEDGRLTWEIRYL